MSSLPAGAQETISLASLPHETRALDSQLHTNDSPQNQTGYDLHVSSVTLGGLGEEPGSDGRINENSLAPVDGGFRAWLFLAGAFLIESLIGGIVNSYGIFLNAYLNDPRIGSQHNAESTLPLIGTLSSGAFYWSGPIVYPLISRYPQHRRISMLVGTLLFCSSLFAASFTQKIWLLILLQGVMYGIGGSLLYAPCISFMSEWFVRRRGLANGVIFAGSATGGLVFPSIISFLLRKHGSSGALRILSITLLILLLPVVPFVRGRLPDPRVRGPGIRNTRRTWATSSVFWFVMLVNTFQGFGYFVPIIWLPTFASAIALSDTQASLVLSLLNGFSAIGGLAYGIVSDHFSPWMLGMSSLLLTSISTFLFWGVLSTSFASMLAFGITFGTLAGGWSSLWTGFVRPIAKDDPNLSTTIFGALMLTRGLGNVLSTPISTSLLKTSGVHLTGRHTGFLVDGGKFENLIFYVGSVFAGGGIIAAIGWAIDGRHGRAVQSQN